MLRVRQPRPNRLKEPFVDTLLSDYLPILVLLAVATGLGIVLMSGCLADRAVPAPLARDPRVRFVGKPFSPSCLVAAVREVAATA